MAGVSKVSRVAESEWQPSDGISLDKQTLAIVKSSGSAAIIAGPGAGKTELLAQRASFLLQTDRCPAPRRILAISFKRDAAKNLTERVRARIGPDLARRMDSFTFDAFSKGLVDRFSSAIPQWCRPERNYKIVFPRAQDWRLVTDSLQNGVNGQQLGGSHTRLNGSSIFPLASPAPSTALDTAVLEWWKRSIGAKPSQLTFGMIATLAITILRHNPMICAALRQTYSHVFLDEFQDTTVSQYELLLEAFGGTGVIATAVGDTKQKIMTWAGALPESFNPFIEHFTAQPRTLVMNFRSNSRIVEIINVLANQIEAEALPVVAARQDDAVPSVSDGVISYSSSAEEASDLASWVKNEVQVHARRPEDFLFLVRQLPLLVEENLGPAFQAKGLVLRNEARPIGGLQIQELMTEPLSDLVIALIQMAYDDRENGPFQRVWDLLSRPFGLDEDRPESQLRLEGAMRTAVATARGLSASGVPADVNFEEFVEAISSQIGNHVLKQLSPDYEETERYSGVKASIAAFFRECAKSAQTWPQLIASYLGREQVKLMTIHKSKGLEAHTVVFLHLQDSGFNQYAEMEEEKFSVFVAASRARERLFVTKTPGSVARTEPLWKMLQAAAIPELEKLGPNS